MEQPSVEPKNIPGLEDYHYSYSKSEIQCHTFSSDLSKLRQKIAPYRFLLAARAITRELPMKAGDKVLELGSGLGLLGKAVKDEVDGDLEYFGIELAFNSAESSLSHGLIESQASTVDLPYPKDTFDKVISTDVLEHIPDANHVISEIQRVLKPGGSAFLVIADPSEGRFRNVSDHIDRTGGKSDVEYWERLFEQNKLVLLRENSNKYRQQDWRKIFNLPFLIRLKDKPGFACAFNPVNRPGTYVVRKPE